MEADKPGEGAAILSDLLLVELHGFIIGIGGPIVLDSSCPRPIIFVNPVNIFKNWIRDGRSYIGWPILIVSLNSVVLEVESSVTLKASVKICIEDNICNMLESTVE